jgi:hypothetical protein
MSEFPGQKVVQLDAKLLSEHNRKLQQSAEAQQQNQLHESKHQGIIFTKCCSYKFIYRG